MAIEAPSSPEFISPFNFEIHDSGKLWTNIQKNASSIADFESIGEEVGQTHTISFSDSRLRLVLETPLSDKRRLTEIVNDRKKAQKLETLLKYNVDGNLRIKGKELHRVIGTQGSQEITKIIGGFAKITWEGNYFHYNPDSQIASEEEFLGELNKGLKIFQIYIDQLYRENGVNPPSATLLVKPAEEQKAGIPGPTIQKYQGLIGERNKVKPSIPKENVEKAFGTAKNEEIDILRQSIIVEQRPNVTLEQIAGQETAVSAIKDLADQLAHPEIFAKWGAEVPRGILLFGPPGTGKTLLGKALAHQASVPFIRVQAHDIASKWHGDSEKLAHGIFQIAREEAAKAEGHVILFLDEVDALIPSRQGNIHEATQKVISTFLQEIDGLQIREDKTRITIVASTNMLENVDRAFLSRMTKWVEVPLPDERGIADILTIHLKAASEKAGRQIVEDGIDMMPIASKLKGASGRDIEDIVETLKIQKAAAEFRSGKESSLISKDDIERTIEASAKVRQAKTSQRAIGFKP